MRLVAPSRSAWQRIAALQMLRRPASLETIAGKPAGRMRAFPKIAKRPALHCLEQFLFRQSGQNGAFEGIQGLPVLFCRFGAGGSSGFWHDFLSVSRAANADSASAEIYRCGEPVRFGILDEMQHPPE